MKTRNVTDLIFFDEEAARTEVLYESEQLFSQVICLQEAQGVGPMQDPGSEGLLVVLSLGGLLAERTRRGALRPAI